MRYILKVPYYPNRQLGEVAIYNPEKCLDNFIWESDGKTIPKEFQPDVTPTFFSKQNFEILSFREKNGYKALATKQKNGYFSCSPLYSREKGHNSEKEMLSFCNAPISNTLQYEIYSVKRLSDGKVFTIGDKVITTKTCPITIIRFEHLGSEIKIWDNYWFNYLEDIKQIAIPLFKTEDNVDIFEGDSWWYVVADSPNPYPRKTNTLVYSGTSNYKKILRFSTEKVANDWIKKNGKPNFVTQDGKNIFPGDEYWALNPKTNSLWKGVCQQGTQKNKGVFYFSQECTAKDYYLNEVATLTLKEVSEVYVSALKPVTFETKYEAQNRKIQEKALSKLTQY